MARHRSAAVRAETVRRHAAGTLHDVNNLLVLVVGCAELALDDRSLTPQTRQLIRDIAGAGERAAALTRQFLVQEHRSAAPPAAVDLRALLQSAETLLGRLAGDRVRLCLDPGDSPQWVLADASQLEQIIINLTLNARDAMPGGGTLSITAGVIADREPRSVTRLTVTDNGRGIDPAIRDRMYDAFVTTKVGGPGSGLGLAVVRAAVDALGGDIHVTTATGQGTTFAIDLPLTDGPGA